MKKLVFLKKYLMLLLCGLLLPTTLWAQVALQQHVVEQGETLYRISKKYGVTVDMLLQHNPGLTAESLSIGKIVQVPVAGQTLPPVVATHKVKKGETMWSISQQYGITVQELMAANPEMQAEGYKMKRGSEVNIPKASPKVKTDTVVVEKKQPKEKKLAQTTLKVGMVMPFKCGAAEGDRCLEYYRGLLMAAEKVGAKDVRIEIYAHNEPAAKESVDSILQLLKPHHLDLLVGPVYPAHFARFAEFAKSEGVKNLVPFSSKVPQVATNPYIYLANSPDANKHVRVSHLFKKIFKGKETVVMLTSSKRNEASFSASLSENLSKDGYTIKTLPLSFSNAELKNLLTIGKQAVLVPDASDFATYKDLMQRLDSFKTEFPGFQTAVLGYPEWQTYASDTLYNIYKANTYLFTNFYHNIYAQETAQFEREYKRKFKMGLAGTYPRMELLGYDSGLCMMQGLLEHGKAFGEQKIDVPMLQSDILFEREGAAGGYINKCMWFIHYKPNHTIEKFSED